MPRPRAAIPTVLIKAKVSPELKGRMALELVSEVEGRIPQGKISEFVSERLREYFSWKRLDLGAYGFPAGFFVAGPKEMIDLLRTALEGRRV